MEAHDGLLARAWIIQLIHTRKAVRLAMRRALKNSGAGISFEMFQVLNCLWQEHGISQQMLAERLGKNKACLPNLMTQLEKRGYIYREEDTHDRRNKLVYLPPPERSFSARSCRPSTAFTNILKLRSALTPSVRARVT